MKFILNQRASVLFVSLVILSLISLVAVLAMQRSNLQIRMVGNFQHQQNLFMAAHNDLHYLYFRLQDPELAGEILSVAIENNESVTASIDPYALVPELQQTSMWPSNVVAVTNRLHLSAWPEGVQHNLQFQEGTSLGVFSWYFFEDLTEVQDLAGNMHRQQIGLAYPVPRSNH